MHSGQLQGFFSPEIPADNLSAVKVGALYFAEIKDLKDPIIVAAGSEQVARAKEFRDILDNSARQNKNDSIKDPLLAMVIRSLQNKIELSKTLPLRPEEEESGTTSDENNIVNEDEQQKNTQTTDLELVGEVDSINGRDAIIVTDIIDTGRALSSATKFLKEKKGARKVYCFASHGVFSKGSMKRIEESKVDQVIVTNTVPSTINEDDGNPIVTRLSLAPLLSEAVRRVFTKESVSDVFKLSPNYKDKA